MTQSSNVSCVLLADRHAILVEPTRDLLKTAFESVYTVGDTQSLLNGAKRLQPTVIVVDLSTLENQSLQLIGEIRQLSPDSKIIALIMHQQAFVLQSVLAAGAHGVVFKCCTAQDLLDGIDDVCHGKQFVSSEFSRLG